MHSILRGLDLGKQKQKLRHLLLASLAAIELGDCRAVARLTCEMARLQNAISLGEKLAW
jgi:hypothetical protein